MISQLGGGPEVAASVILHPTYIILKYYAKYIHVYRIVQVIIILRLGQSELPDYHINNYTLEWI